MYICTYTHAYKFTITYAFDVYLVRLYIECRDADILCVQDIHKFTNLHIPMHLIYTTYINCAYGVATISKLLKITGLFCKRDLQKSQCSAKGTNNLKEPTNRSHLLMVATPYLHFT